MVGVPQDSESCPSHITYPTNRHTRAHYSPSLDRKHWYRSLGTSSRYRVASVICRRHEFLCCCDHRSSLPSFASSTPFPRQAAHIPLKALIHRSPNSGFTTPRFSSNRPSPDSRFLHTLACVTRLQTLSPGTKLATRTSNESSIPTV